MSKLNEHELISRDQVKALIATAVQEAKQEVYREIADSLESAGEMDLYNHTSMDQQAAHAGCAMAGERIQWLVEE